MCIYIYIYIYAQEYICIYMCVCAWNTDKHIDIYIYDSGARFAGEQACFGRYPEGRMTSTKALASSLSMNSIPK